MYRSRRRDVLMRRSVPAIFAVGAAVVSVAFVASAAQPDDEATDYYADAEGLTGDELKNALHEIVSDSTTLTYDEVWSALRDTDEDPADPESVILLYSGRSLDEDANGGGSGEWNREHVWPKSHGDFGTAPGPGTDVHHLRPTDVAGNAGRGSEACDVGGSAVDGAPGDRPDGDWWGPRGAVKGDVAPMRVYEAARYDGDDGYPDLEGNGRVDN